MKQIKRSVHWAIIIILFFLGFVGLMLPLVPQTIFFVLAIILISFEFPKFADYLESKLKSYPYAYKIYHAHRSKFEKYFEN